MVADVRERRELGMVANGKSSGGVREMFWTRGWVIHYSEYTKTLYLSNTCRSEIFEPTSDAKRGTLK